MSRNWLFLATICFATTAFAREPKPYQTGTLVRMDSVPCGVAEKDAKSLTGELLGTDSGSKKSQQVLCPEYVLRTNVVIYHLRPKDEKHPVLLPIGDHAQFRLDRDKVILRVEDLDNKDREYIVTSMAPRSETDDDVSAGSGHQ